MAKGKRRGINRINKTRISNRTNKTQKKRLQAGRSFLGKIKSTGRKRVGNKKDFELAYTNFNTKRLNKAQFLSKGFQEELLTETKIFRKKFKTTKTRVIATFTLRRAGKSYIKSISMTRSEVGSVSERIDDTMNTFGRFLSHYRKAGYRFGTLRGIQLGRATKTKAKKGKSKHALRRVRSRSR